MRKSAIMELTGKGAVMEKTKADVILKDFWRDNERFADLFNTVLFQGENIIHAEELQEMDTDVSGVIEMEDYRETLARTRDVVKKTACGVDFILIGLELQEKVHYAMPLRHMLYDGMTYLKDYKQISLRNARSGRSYSSGSEFLSKMRKEDRLRPVVSLTLYYGEELWDGPQNLKDMLAEIPDEISEVVSDYRMNLLEIRESGKYRFNKQRRAGCLRNIKGCVREKTGRDPGEVPGCGSPLGDGCSDREDCRIRGTDPNE